MNKIMGYILIGLIIGGSALFVLSPTIISIVIWILLNPVTFWMKFALLAVLLTIFTVPQIWAGLLFLILLSRLFDDRIGYH